MNPNDKAALHALIEVFAAVPSAMRAQLGTQAALILTAMGLDPLAHGYLIKKRPRALAPTAAPRQPPRLAARRFHVTFHADTQEPAGAEAWASLTELAELCDRSPRMVELWLADQRRHVYGRAQATHNRTPGGGVVRFTQDPDWEERTSAGDAPTIQDALTKIAGQRRGY